jgi:hypothetical protein
MRLLNGLPEEQQCYSDHCSQKQPLQ